VLEAEHDRSGVQALPHAAEEFDYPLIINP
jgi:hypothetical protein